MSKTASELLFDLEKKYDPSKISEDTVFHFNMAGDGGGEYTVTVQDGTCKVSEGMNGEAKCVVTTKAETFVSVMKGQTNPMMAVMTGKLKISNTGEMMKFAKPFGLM